MSGRPTPRTAAPAAYDPRTLPRPAGPGAYVARRPTPRRVAPHQTHGLPPEAGQATVEFVALLPALLLVALAAAAVLAGHGAREQAGQAAQAGAMAMFQGGDPRDSARRALPAGVRGRAEIEVGGRRVTVRVRPRLPIVANAMTAEVSADAGPEASP